MARKRKGDKVDGWINLDKPAGMTSTQAVGKVRWLLNAQKAGHAGTLDPLATGILPIALGEATKTVPFAQDRLKTYRFTVKWGEQRDTDDAEGDATQRSDARPDVEAIENILPRFTGTIKARAAHVLDFERRHRAIVDRFGRYPHRNEVLGRVLAGGTPPHLTELPRRWRTPCTTAP